MDTDSNDQDQQSWRPWRKRMASGLSALLIVVVVVLTAPFWPDGPITAAATWVRQQVGLEPKQPIDVSAAFGLDDVFTFDEGADEQTAEQTTRVFRVSLGASEGYFAYTAGIPEEEGDGFFGGLSPEAPVSRLVEFFDQSVEQLTEARATASSELAELDVLLGELEAQGMEELLGVPLVRIREYSELVSDYGETFGESELAFLLCASEQLERFPPDDLIGDAILAAAGPILQCATEHDGDPEAEDELYSQMRESTVFLFDGWGPRCLPSDLSFVESLTEVLAEIDCH